MVASWPFAGEAVTVSGTSLGTQSSTACSVFLKGITSYPIVEKTFFNEARVPGSRTLMARITGWFLLDTAGPSQAYPSCPAPPRRRDGEVALPVPPGSPAARTSIDAGPQGAARRRVPCQRFPGKGRGRRGPRWTTSGERPAAGRLGRRRRRARPGRARRHRRRRPVRGGQSGRRPVVRAVAGGGGGAPSPVPPAAGRAAGPEGRRADGRVGARTRGATRV